MLCFIHISFYLAPIHRPRMVHNSSHSHPPHAIQYTSYRDGIQFGSNKNRCLYTKIQLQRNMYHFLTILTNNFYYGITKIILYLCILF
jgi:hypothetical protein